MLRNAAKVNVEKLRFRWTSLEQEVSDLLCLEQDAFVSTTRAVLIEEGARLRYVL
jgi:hypothetical protein